VASKERIKLGGAWAKTAKDGTKYIMGPLTHGTNIMIYPNKYKKSDKDPDYIISLGEKKVDIEHEVAQEFPDVPF
jgi:uncharacterized protein (DUF736 family)